MELEDIHVEGVTFKEESAERMEIRVSVNADVSVEGKDIYGYDTFLRDKWYCVFFSGILDDYLHDLHLLRVEPLVKMWRNSNQHIVEYWWDVDRAVKRTVQYREETKVGKVTFSYKSGMLIIKLPSGRKLTYVKPHMGLNRYGSESVLYYGLDSTKHWSEIEAMAPSS